MKQTITLEVNLGPQFEEDEDGDIVAVNADDVSQQIIHLVAEKLVAKYSYSEDRVLMEAIDEAVKVAVVERVTATMQRPMQRFASVGYYDQHSTPIGEKFTLDELIAGAVQKFVDSKESSSDGYGRQSGPKNLQQTVDLAVQEYLAKEAKAVIAEAKREVNTAVLEKIKAGVAAAMAPQVK